MQVPVINLFSYNTIHEIKGSAKRTQNPYVSAPNDIFIKSKENPTFGIKLSTTSIIDTEHDFRELTRNRTVHCIYCNKPMINVSLLDELRNREVLSGKIKNVLKELAPYKECLRGAELGVFNRIEEIAKSAPTTTLSRIIQYLHNEAITNLRKAQLPIFKQIEKQSRDLPPTIQPEFQKLLTIHRNRILGIPQIETFSEKDFAYKLRVMSKSVPNARLSYQLKEFGEIMKNTAANKNNEIYDKLYRKIFHPRTARKAELPITRKEIQLGIVEKVTQIAKKLDREDILQLCKNAENMLNKKPVCVQFSNKAFIHDIDKLLETIENTELRKSIISTASSLPNSDSSVDSFITKHIHSDSNAIAYAIFRAPITTIEHITPRSNKTKNKANIQRLGNMALACSHCNNSRSNGSMGKYMSKFPSENPQIYFNDIIGVVNEGFISVEDLLQMKHSIYTESNRKLNLSKISTKVLRDTFSGSYGQARFDELCYLAKEDLISTDDLIELQKILAKRCAILVKF